MFSHLAVQSQSPVAPPHWDPDPPAPCSVGQELMGSSGVQRGELTLLPSPLSCAPVPRFAQMCPCRAVISGLGPCAWLRFGDVSTVGTSVVPTPGATLRTGDTSLHGAVP